MSKNKQLVDTPIAVVGISAIFPAAINVQGFWKNILDGKDCITAVPPNYWLIEDYYDPDPQKKGKTYARRGAFLPKVSFDPMEFGLPPKNLADIDSVQLLALIVAKNLLDGCISVRSGKVDRSQISVILGCGAATEMMTQMMGHTQKPNWVKAMRESGLPESMITEITERASRTYIDWTENNFPGGLGNVTAGRIANRLNLGGTNCIVDAACASSLGAVAMAVHELQLGHSDLIITGGADAHNDIFTFMCFSKTPVLSPTGDCRPFSDRADGTLLGEGVGMVALRRLEDAERDGDPIYALIRGVGTSSDGMAKSIYAPNAEGQALAIRRAYAAAGFSPAQVELVEAHGTATKANDKAEFEGLCRVFDEKSRRQGCALGSVKSQIGHTKSAAGAASLIKTVLGLHHKVLPPTIKVERPNPDLDFANSPFYLNTYTRPWVSHPDSSRKASLSAFGFGGSNFHLALEEYRGPGEKAKRFRSSPVELLLLGAGKSAEMDRQIGELETKLKTISLTGLAQMVQEVFRPDSEFRLALLAKDADEAASLIREARPRIQGAPEQNFSIPNKIHYAVGGSCPKIAFLFPGQGSQYLNMGADLAMEFEAVQKTWDLLAGAYHKDTEKLHQVVFPIPVFHDDDRQKQADLLSRPEWAQPAVGAVSLSQLHLLSAIGIKADGVAGHGDGEVTALFAAGALSASEDVVSILRRRGMLMAQTAADSAPGAEPFHQLLDSVPFRAPVIPVYANSTGKIYPQNNAAIRSTLAGQMACPVLFQNLIDAMYADGVRIFLEVGPGSTLTRRVTDYLGARDHLAVAMDQEDQNGVSSFWNALGVLASAGIDIQFESLWKGFFAADNLKDGKKRSAATIQIDGSNFGKPYPPKEGAAALPKPIPDSPLTIWARNILNGRTGALPMKATGPFSNQGPAMANCSGDYQWLTAFRELQDNLFNAHQMFQKTLTDSHLAFIKSSERAFAEIDRMAPAGRGRETVSDAFQIADVPPFQELRDGDLSVPTFSDKINADDKNAIPEAGAPDKPQKAGSKDTLGIDADTFKRVMLEIVSELTGYPQEVLDLQTDLESGFGIDSIKKMEILSGFQDRFPAIELQDTEALSRLNTLQEILEYVKATFGSPGVDKTGDRVNAESTEIRKEIHRYTPAYIPAPATGQTLAGLGNADPLYIIEDNKGVAPVLAEQLNAKGIHAKVVGDLPEAAAAVLFLKGINDLPPEERVDTAIELNRSAFEMAGKCGLRMRKEGGVFITVQDTHGDFGISADSGERAWSAGIGALTKTAAKEWPKASIKAIDIACGHRSAEDIARSILVELLEGGPEPEVGLRADGHRFRLDITDCELTGTRPPLPGGDVVIASGGAQGITAACLLALADRSKLKFMILGRTPLRAEPEYTSGCKTDAEIKQAILEEYKRRDRNMTPAEMASETRKILSCRKIRSTLHGLEARGSEAKYFAVDIRHADALNRTVSEIHAAWGEIRMLIHGAGIISDKYIHEKKAAQFDDVFTTKVVGFHNLLSAIGKDPLTHIFCMSSVVAQKGHAGQVDYAMANATLNKVCQFERKRRKGQCRVKALNWGPWDAGMVTPQHKALFKSAGYSLIPVDEGARVFVREMEDDGDNRLVEVILLSGEPEIWLNHHPNG